MLPGGRAVLFTITTTGGNSQSQVAALDLSTGTSRVLVRGGSDAQYVAPGYLVYAAAGTLRAVRFDPGRLEIAGTEVLALDGLGMSPQAVSNASVSADGTLVYVPADAAGPGRSLVWVNRHGEEEPLEAPPRAYVYPRLSPDGTQVAVYSFDEQHDVWLSDLRRRRLTRATFDSDSDIYPVWTPDGQRLVWASGRAGPFNLYMQAADGTGVIERLTESGRNQIPTAVTTDGTRVILREEERPGTGTDLMLLMLDGGRQALWARNGGELFYRAPNGVVVTVPVEAGAAVFRAGAPTVLIDGPYLGATGAHVGRTYDVAPAAARFLMIREGGGTTGAPPVIDMVVNWPEELKRLLPTN
jgi:serine/threonine-protein kinase